MQKRREEANTFLTLYLVHSFIDNVCLHLTNYSINKNSVNSAKEEDAGGKK